MKKAIEDLDELFASIKKSISQDNSSLNKWNTNYFNTQKERYKNDIKYINNLGKINSILEIGAAPFHLTVCLQKLGYDISVIDLDPSRFKWFIDSYGLKVDICNIETDELSYNNKFDLILLTEVFEHLRINPQKTLTKLYNQLDDDGYFYLTTPNFYKITNVSDFIKGKGVANAFYQFNKLNTIGHMGHVREYTKNEVTLFLESVGFKIVDFDYKNATNFPFFSKQNLASLTANVFKSHMRFLCKKA